MALMNEYEKAGKLGFGRKNLKFGIFFPPRSVHIHCEGPLCSSTAPPTPTSARASCRGALFLLDLMGWLHNFDFFLSEFSMVCLFD